MWQLVQKLLCHWLAAKTSRAPNASQATAASSTPPPSSEEPTCADYEEDFHTFTLEEVTMGEEPDVDLDIVVRVRGQLQ